MQLTDHEQKLLLRALDKASAPAEVEKAAQALIVSLRKRGISGFDLLDQFKATASRTQSSGTPEQPTRRYHQPQQTNERTEEQFRCAQEAVRRYREQSQQQARQQAKQRPWWKGGIYDRINEWDRTRVPIDPLRVVGKILGFGSLGLLSLAIIVSVFSHIHLPS